MLDNRLAVDLLEEKRLVTRCSDVMIHHKSDLLLIHLIPRSCRSCGDGVQGIGLCEIVLKKCPELTAVSLGIV
jgi:hypothetical protein